MCYCWKSVISMENSPNFNSEMLSFNAERMESVTQSSGQKTSTLSISLLTLLVRLFFFRPNLEPQQNKKVHFIFVDVSSQVLTCVLTAHLWVLMIIFLSLAFWTTREVTSYGLASSRIFHRHLTKCLENGLSNSSAPGIVNRTLIWNPF